MKENLLSLIILCKIFEKIFHYSYIRCYKDKKPYIKLVPKASEKSNSQVFVVNAKDSNIKYVNDTEYLDSIFSMLIENYSFDFDNAAIYYIWDRDYFSNDPLLINSLIQRLGNSRDSIDSFDRQGLLLLSYPSIESYTYSNFHIKGSCLNEVCDTGGNLKFILDSEKKLQNKICLNSIQNAAKQLYYSLDELNIHNINYDNFTSSNKLIFDYQEKEFMEIKKYHLLSLLSIALFDLGLLNIL